MCHRYSGDARLYELDTGVEYRDGYNDEGDPIIKSAHHIVVSAAEVLYSGPETYIFAANEDGKIVNWTELDGSYRGGLDHSVALTNAGIELVDSF